MRVSVLLELSDETDALYTIAPCWHLPSKGHLVLLLQLHVGGGASWFDLRIFLLWPVIIDFMLGEVL